MSSYYDTDHEPPDPDEPTTRPQPDDYCECRPGTQLRKPSAHAPECLRWRPPLSGPGSTDEHRAAALAHIRSQIESARQRHQEAS